MEKKSVFKFSKHCKLWATMPEYILQEAKPQKRKSQCRKSFAGQKQGHLRSFS